MQVGFWNLSAQLEPIVSGHEEHRFAHTGNITDVDIATSDQAVDRRFDDCLADLSFQLLNIASNLTDVGVGDLDVFLATAGARHRQPLLPLLENKLRSRNFLLGAANNRFAYLHCQVAILRLLQADCALLFQILVARDVRPRVVQVGLRLQERGWHASYVPAARVKHFVPRSKCNLTHLAERAEATGFYFAIADRQEISRILRTSPLLYLGALRRLLKWGWARGLGRKAYPEYLQWRRQLGLIKGARVAPLTTR